ncbi:MAG TPA: hypothetical protein VLV55_13500 [Rhizomicrobium sp.]|nr:hypothetical protein [Rhizomicrobium sp.]
MRKALMIGLVTAGWASLLPAMAADVHDPAGEKAMHDYVLTMSKVKAYDAASSAATAALKADSSLKAEADKSSNEPDKTFADIKAKFMHHPRLMAFYAKQGLTADDAVLVPLTLMSACTVAQYPQIAAKMASTVSPGQVAFCKQNMATLKTMKFFSGGGE